MKIYNLIVTYNRSHMLDLVLSRLESLGFENVILVNNASTDNTDAIVQRYINKLNIIYHKNEINLGGAGGFNVASKLFLENCLCNDYAIFHDDDSWPAFEYKNIRSAISESDSRMGCFPVLYPEGDLNKMNIPGKAGFLNNLTEIFVKRRPNDLNEFDMWDGFDYCGFVGFLVNYDILKSIGLPSPSFFIYSDDTYYTLACTRRFGKLTNFSLYGLTFVHDCKRATGSILLSSNFAFYDVRNKVILLRTFSKYHILFTTALIVKSLFSAPSKLLLIAKAVFSGYNSDLSDYRPQLRV